MPAGRRLVSGPLTWASRYPSASGNRQSPVNIDTDSVTYFPNARAMVLRYTTHYNSKLVNPGYGWKVEMKDEDSELSGGPLDGVYKLEQFHCHWGCDNDKGSEHTVNGSSFAGELHLVHWNSTKYKSFAEAANFTDGLAVLAVFLKVGSEHEELEKVVGSLSEIAFRGESVDVKEKIDPTSLLPKVRTYWTYQGSLTTPPCTENVTWIIYKEPIQVSERQLRLFRNLRCHRREDVMNASEADRRIVNNFRPPLPLGNRELRECGSL